MKKVSISNSYFYLLVIMAILIFSSCTETVTEDIGGGPCSTSPGVFDFHK